jgi:hypothetical protein
MNTLLRPPTDLVSAAMAGRRLLVGFLLGAMLATAATGPAAHARQAGIQIHPNDLSAAARSSTCWPDARTP